MSIRRAARPESGFYVLSNSISGDRRLSWGARGMLVFLLSKPDHWVVSIANLINETADCAGRPSGRDAVYGLLRELIDVGYVRRMQERRQDGSLAPVEYEVSEVPVPLTEDPDAAPLTDPPHAGEPHPANPQQAKTDPEKGPKRSKDRGARAALSVQTFDVATLVAKGVAPEDAATWIMVRAKKRQVNSMLALANVESAAIAAGLTLAQAVHVSATRSWAGFNGKWLDQHQPATSGRGGAAMTDAELAEADARAKQELFGPGAGEVPVLSRTGDTWEAPR